MTDTPSRPALLWVSAGYWLVSGIAGLIPIVIAFPMLSQMAPEALLFVAAAALSHAFSLWGAILLLRRKQSAIVFLVLVFILGAVALLLTGKSPGSLDTFAIVLWAIAAATVAYAIFLRRKGVLT